MSEAILGILIPSYLYYIGIGVCIGCAVILLILEIIKNHRNTKKESQKNIHVNIPELVSWKDHLIIPDLTILIGSMYLFFIGTQFLKLRVSNIGMIFNVIVGTSVLMIFLESYRDPLETSKESEMVIVSNVVFATLLGNQQFVTLLIDFLNLSNDIYITISLIFIIGLHYVVFLFCVLYSTAIVIRKIILMSKFNLRSILSKILNVINPKKVAKRFTHPLLRWYESRYSLKE